MTSPAIDEDEFNNGGTLVSALISGHVSDADTGVLMLDLTAPSILNRVETVFLVLAASCVLWPRQRGPVMTFLALYMAVILWRVWSVRYGARTFWEYMIERPAHLLVSSFAVLVLAGSLQELISNCDLVVEAASVKISADILEKAIAAKRDSLIMSVGGLLGREDLLEAARNANVKVYLPSGAILGIDGLKAISTADVESVTLTTRKPVAGLKGAPYLEGKGIDLDSIKGETAIFEGPAREAVKAF